MRTSGIVLLFLAACGGAAGSGTTGASATASSSSNGGASGSSSSTSGSPGVPRIDEVGYYRALAVQRPDLLQGGATVCYDTLVLQQRYRLAVLDGGASYASLAEDQEADAGTAADQAYLSAQQQSELAFCQATPVAGCNLICSSNYGSCAACPSQAIVDGSAPTPAFYPSGYSLCALVGYEEGEYGQQINQNGIDYKVFFEFADPTSTLTPQLYQTFSDALADAGYQGDSKILTDPSLPLQARLQYNDVITHSATIADAELLEQLGLSMFAGLITGHGRGVDVGPPVYTTLVDWHTYLCDVQGSLSALPADTQAYLLFQD